MSGKTQELDLAGTVMRALGPDAPKRLGVAVSGGGDSTALLYAAVEAGFAVEAATVDHCLRPESRAEAEEVGAVCTGLGVPHRILTWDGPGAEGNTLAAARLARLRLMGAWARERGLDTVLIAHTADDQAETFLMRIGRSAGLEGLSGIRPRFFAEGVWWRRPMLSVGRAALRDWLRARNIGWVDDPSNENLHYMRARTRRLLATLAPIRVTPATLGRTIAHLAEANRALDGLWQKWCIGRVTEKAGEISVPAEEFAGLEPELGRRLLAAALVWVSGAEYAPRAEKLSALLEKAVAAGGAFRATLHGCRVSRARGRLTLCREAAAVASLRVPVKDGVALWDGWRIAAPSDGAPEGAEVSMLGREELRKTFPEIRGPERAALAVSPAIWLDGRLLAAPLAGLTEGWEARNLRGSFPQAGLRR